MHNVSTPCINKSSNSLLHGIPGAPKQQNLSSWISEFMRY